LKNVDKGAQPLKSSRAVDERLIGHPFPPRQPANVKNPSPPNLPHKTRGKTTPHQCRAPSRRAAIEP
jgi:hypothetical protein